MQTERALAVLLRRIAGIDWCHGRGNTFAVAMGVLTVAESVAVGSANGHTCK